MTGIYKDKRLWADWPTPDPHSCEDHFELLEKVEQFNSRPSWEVSPQLQARWKDGERYEEGVDFQLADNWQAGARWGQICIPYTRFHV